MSVFRATRTVAVVEVTLASLMLTAMLLGPVVSAAVIQSPWLTVPMGALIFPASWALFAVLMGSYGIEAALVRVVPCLLCMALAWLLMALTALVPGGQPSGYWSTLACSYLLSVVTWSVGATAGVAASYLVAETIRREGSTLTWWVGLTVAQISAACVGVPVFYGWWLHSALALDVFVGRLALSPVYALLMTALMRPLSLWLRAHVDPGRRQPRLRDVFRGDTFSDSHP